MRGKLIGLSCIFASLLATTAAAQQQPEIVSEGGIGLGIEQNLGGLSGAAFSYDAGRFRIDAILGIAHWNEAGTQNDQTDFGIGGRFFFKVHEMPGADFSVGGGIAIVQVEVGDFDDTTIHLEAAAQIRIFVVPNVALSGSLGLVLMTADDGQTGTGPIAAGHAADTVYGIGGQLLAGFGAIYYFR